MAGGEATAKAFGEDTLEEEERGAGTTSSVLSSEVPAPVAATPLMGSATGAAAELAPEAAGAAIAEAVAGIFACRSISQSTLHGSASWKPQLTAVWSLLIRAWSSAR
jgi:hypothetical protein